MYLVCSTIGLHGVLRTMAAISHSVFEISTEGMKSISLVLIMHCLISVLLTACACSLIGANESSCHPVTGQCSCRENVVGLLCNSCQTNFYDFNSGAGCSACNCNPVYSSNLQCDGSSGVCSCKPGINGGKCTGCADQFYNLTNQGKYIFIAHCRNVRGLGRVSCIDWMENLNILTEILLNDKLSSQV